MQISKKLYTSLIVTMLALSAIIAAVPMVSAEITAPPDLDVTEGPVGTEVTVSGTGSASPFSTVTAYLDALDGAVLGTDSADVAGSYSMDIVIPPTFGGEHYIVVNDGETESDGAPFNVTQVLTANVTLALPGDAVLVEGNGFGASEDVTLTLNSTINNVTLAVSPITTGNGAFTAEFIVPAIDIANFTTYDLIAIDESNNTDSVPITIDYYITVIPDSGPVSITTTISGRIAPSVAYTILFNGATIGSGTTTADGSYMNTYTIPTILSIDTYPVQVLWAGTTTRNATFEVTESPTISLSSPSGMVGDEITVSSILPFSSSADVTLTFGGDVLNDTSMGFGPTTAGGDLPADATFTVPNMAVGTYAVIVSDEYGAVSNTVMFTIVVTPVMMIQTRAMSYMQGDQISIYTWSNSPVPGAFDFSITDPMGEVLVSSSVNGPWMEMSANNYMVGNYYSSLLADPEFMTLPADAPVGTWNFTATIGAMTYSNLFTVSAPASLDDVVGGIANVTDDIAAVSDEISDLSSDISGEISDISGDIATIQTDVAHVEALVTDLDITSLTGDLAIIQSDLGTLTMDVSSLDAVVGNIAGDVVTVMTNLGELEGTITSIDGNVATIETDVGTLQADMSDVKANVDSTPAWIAVVLALVAAVAAIFAVITIRQKIAG